MIFLKGTEDSVYRAEQNPLIKKIPIPGNGRMIQVMTHLAVLDNENMTDSLVFRPRNFYPQVLA